MHGGGGQFSDWLRQTPDKMTVHRLTDQYNLIIVMPEGERPGGHTWEYWQNALPYQVLFLNNVLKINNIAVP